MINRYSLLSLFCCVVFLGHVSPAFAAPKILSFDLFGITPKLLSLELRKFGPAIDKTLSKRMKEPKLATIQFADYRSFCFKVDGKIYELTRKDSETEGFIYKLTGDPERMDACAGPYLLPIKYEKVFSKADFTPLSTRYPELQLGKSTPHDIEKMLGNATFQNEVKMIYVIERDRRKEKDCYQDPKKGEFQAINVAFFFNKKGKLDSIYFSNCIMGQCGCVSS